jgi:acyl-CoA thioester hydrolase
VDDQAGLPELAHSQVDRHGRILCDPVQSPREHTLRIKVRQYEMDALGHVNNAVYLHYVEEVAVEHARRLGYDEARWRELGGTWVVRSHQIEYRLPAVAGDELDVTTRVVGLERTRGTRHTTIVRVRDGASIVEATTVWIWVGLDGRPRRVPAEALADFHATEEPT